MKNKKLLLLTVLLLAVLIGSSFAYNQMKDRVAPQGLAAVQTQPPQTEPQPAEELVPGAGTQPQADATEAASAPDFVVYDADGNEVSLSDLRGKPVIVNFWATWCGYCVQEMPDFQAVYEEYGDQIHFMMINVTDGYQETQEKAMDFVAKNGLTLPIYYDLDLNAADTYRVNAMPVTYLFDENGTAVARQVGAVDEQILRSVIPVLLGE